MAGDTKVQIKFFAGCFHFLAGKLSLFFKFSGLLNFHKKTMNVGDIPAGPYSAVIRWIELEPKAIFTWYLFSVRFKAIANETESLIITLRQRYFIRLYIICVPGKRFYIYLHSYEI